MNSLAVVMRQPEQLVLDQLLLTELTDADVVVQLEFSGISTGTEKLLWTGRMPQFPGMGYPLVPGYESVGHVVQAGDASGLCPGQRVYVPGANCFGPVRGLFGGAASKLVVPGKRVFAVDPAMGEQAVLLALAATAYHAVAGGGLREPFTAPDLIVGHGVLGRLLARLNVAAGNPTTVWELNDQRSQGARGYTVLRPEDDPRKNYRAVYDVSGDSTILDSLIGRMAPGGEIVLAGFYSERLSFAFAPAFMREVHIRAAAEWKRADMLAVLDLVQNGRLSLDGLISHHERAEHADVAYRTAFGDIDCTKMVLDWRHNA
jgi:bacteriochlorophyllide a dehydrogenase